MTLTYEEKARTDARAVASVGFIAVMNPPELAGRLFGPSFELLRLAGATPLHLRAFPSLDTPEARDVLRRAEVLITSWGAPPLTDPHLDAAPRLRYVLHAGGQAAPLLPQGTAERGIAAANAGWSNAIPVAEYTVAMIVLANKDTFRARRLYRHRRDHIDRELEFPAAGNAGKTIGVVGASRIGRMVIERLAGLSVSVLLYDPFITPADATRLGVRLVSLDEVMANSDIVTLHPPLNDATAGMITARHLGLMRDGATLINTSRGAIVDQDALIVELRAGRIEAILDVTHPEVLPEDSELHTLPNVFLTPHISGSMGTEIRRMGEHIASELNRIVEGQPLAFPELLR
jgi:phosphoglycerate dehydrogenase-like enzyme